MFKRLRKLDDTLQANNSQRTMHLMQACACALQRAVGRRGNISHHFVAGLFQRQVDFTLDPGQRSDVRCC